MAIKLSCVIYLKYRHVSIPGICYYLPEALGGIVSFCQFFCFCLLPWNGPSHSEISSLAWVQGIKRHMEQSQMKSSRDTSSCSWAAATNYKVLCCWKPLRFRGHLWMQQSWLIYHLIRNARNGFCEWESECIELNPYMVFELFISNYCNMTIPPHFQ